jgi:serine/threonine protein kinase/tetratricopeptide (TPR) repeat protein
MTLTPGTRLGSYEITSLLGSGGMGQVYRAKDLKLGRDVAIKVLREDFASDPDRLRRFEQEARSASALNHPNIITIHDIGKHGETPYIAMEFVEGKTLREMLTDGPLPTKKLLQLATQIAEGLAKAHSAGIVHRDLKPENLMVSSDGYVKILDFGLAKLLPEAVNYGSEDTTITKELTRAGVILGTIGYMSPEQASGRPLDHRSDQFSFGSILYEMVTGKIAFKRETAAEMLAAIIEGEPEPVAKVNPDVPPHLRVIVECCLEKRPEERYESTRDLSRELEGLREIPFTLPAILTRRTVLAGISALLVLGFVLLVGLNVGGLRDRLLGVASPIDSLAVLPLANQSGDPEQEYFVDGITEAIITDLAKISALKVISRNSAMRYKDTDKSIPEIAEELGVDAVIEGSVLREGGRVRVTAQLIEASTDQYLWADNFEQELRDIMTLYSDVARTIAQEIEIAVTPEEETRLASVRPVNPGAHDAYLKGSYHSDKMTPEDLEIAKGYFDLALEKDPSYASAYEGLAWVWAVRQQRGITAPHEAGPKAKALALQAIALDDSSAITHRTLAGIKTWTDWDWAGAEQEWRRALELDPNLASAHAFFAHFLGITGRIEEALPHGERAIELDPLNALFQGLHAQVLCAAGRYDDAMALSRNAMALQPNVWAGTAYGGLMCAFVLKGMRDEHLDLERERNARDHERMAAFEQGFAEAGYEGAMRGIAKLQSARYESSRGIPDPSVQNYGRPYAIAHWYLMAGDYDRSIEWLEKAFEVRDPGLPYVNFRPFWAPLRSDPRFQDLLRRMNLPVQ